MLYKFLLTFVFCILLLGCKHLYNEGVLIEKQTYYVELVNSQATTTKNLRWILWFKTADRSYICVYVGYETFLTHNLGETYDIDVLIQNGNIVPKYITCPVMLPAEK